MTSRPLRLGNEQVGRGGLEHDVAAAPGLVIDQPPLVPAPAVIGRNQHVARTQNEGLAIARREFQSP
jgi:hypothetical protein